MPTLCRVLAAVVAAGTAAWLAGCAWLAVELPAERTGMICLGVPWLPVGLLAAGRTVRPPPNPWRRLEWAVTAAVPAGCLLWLGIRHGHDLKLNPGPLAIIGWWAYALLAGLVGLVLDGDPRPAGRDDEN